MRTVLVVDDNSDIRLLIKKGLELEGYQVLTAENGLDAQERLKNGARPSLVLLDLMMPVMDGRDFLQWKNTQAQYADITVVVISAAVDEKSTLSGASEVLRKPVDLEILIDLAERFA